MCHDTNDCIMIGGADLVSRHRTLRVVIRRPAPCDTTQERCFTHGSALCMGLSVTIQFCITTGGAIRQEATCDTAPKLHNKALYEPRNDASARHDTAQHTACVQPVRSLGHGCVHCALDPVLTQCTVLSHCLDHCS